MNWKPENKEIYWFIDSRGVVFGKTWFPESDTDQRRLKHGNCFKTTELAEKAAKKIREILINLDHE